MSFTLIVKSYNIQNLVYFDLLLRKLSLEIVLKKSKKQSSLFVQSLHGKSKEKFQYHVIGFHYLVSSKLPAFNTLQVLKKTLLFLPSGCFADIQIQES